MQKISTFFMFEGNAEEAMNFYTSLFEETAIKAIERYGKDGPGKEGTVKMATFVLEGQEFMCIDSFVKHQFGFTPAMSLYVCCKTQGEINGLFAQLANGGQVMMPLDKYPFSERFGWVSDKFGVSWQLNLKED